MYSFLISFLVTALTTPLVIVLAHRLGWVAKPRADRWHTKPTALMGGIAIFIGTVTAWLAGGDLQAVLPLAIPAAGIFLLGAVDDRLTLKPHLKLIGQIAATAALMVSGFRFEALPPYLALPLTLIWVVGITNAVNLLDNMDGLAAGVCGISALAMAGYCLMESGAATVPAVFALAGACAGFLIYNFNPAKIFMGDCGSMFLGFSLAALAVQGTQRTAPNLMLSMLVPVAVLAIPIFDTTLVSVARTLHGRSISQGGRDHSSHRLVALGLSERSTVLALYTLTAIFGGLALATTRMPLSGVLVVGAVAFMALMNLGLYLGFLKVYTEPSDAPAHVRLIGGMVQHKKQLLQVGIDLMLAPAAFVGAHLLRFEGRFPPEHAEAVLAALPFVVVTKLVGLAVCKAYRGVWRYAGLADAITATAGSMLGSIFTLVVLGTLTGFHHLSRAALFVDWLMFTMLVVASRTGYVMLREVFGLLPPQHGPRVVILGAGVEVITLLHRLRDPLSPQRAYVVGILDNDRGKRGRTLNGAPVLGPVSDLPALIDSQEITFCVLGVSPLSESGRRILEYCEELNITVHRDLDTPPLAMTGERLVPATA